MSYQIIETNHPPGMTLSSIQLARLVQAYVAGPGASLEEKAARVGVRRNELLRAGRGAISRTIRLRLLAFFAGVGALIARGNGDLHELRAPPGVARRTTRARQPRVGCGTLAAAR